MTTPIDPTMLTPRTTPARSDAPAAMDGLGKDAFLKLLVAQLRFQNPLSPVDGSEYMAQVAQFSQVEALLDIKRSQQDAALWQRNVAAEAMVGRHVTGTDLSGNAVGGVVSGVKLTADGPIVRIGNVDLPAERITEIRTAS